MKINTKLYSLIRIKSLYYALGLLIVNVAFAAGIMYFGFSTYKSYSNIQSIENEIILIRQKVTLIRNNQAILLPHIDQFNKLLEELVPVDESYFSVIAALETLSVNTGVSISSYSIDLKSTTEEKLGLQISMNGNEEVFRRFLDEYVFASGRLLTNGSISISKFTESSMSFPLSFYHKAAETAVDGSTQLKIEDIEFMKDISSKLAQYNQL